MPEEIELEPAAPKAPKAKAPKVEEKPAGYSKFLKSATAFAYNDPDTGVRYSPTVPVRVDAEPKEGSWLACQIEAGYIIEA